MPKLRVLDLFSGIGGFSYGLETVARTVGYCEIDVGCREVLEARMADGRLGRAPVLEDVTKLRGADLQGRVDMITGGFPCQDLSAANPGGAGLDGERSGLVREVLRLVDELSDRGLRYVFLENSPMIVKNGLGWLLRAMKKRGFECRWAVIKALDVGAFHSRRRWYALFYKKNGDVRRLPLIKDEWIREHEWKPYPCAGVLKKSRVAGGAEGVDACMRRCMALGNSVVPQCVAHAWNTLVRGVDGENEVVPITRRDPLNVELDDGVVVIVKPFWATPCHNKKVWYPWSHLTPRGSDILCNQLYYSRRTRTAEGRAVDKKMVFNQYTCNPVFVEHMMGYPKGWTQI